MMDVDIDIDLVSSQTSSPQHLTRFDRGDVVRWQSSQSTCAPLEALLAQSSKSKQQEGIHKHHHLSIWDAPGPSLVGNPGGVPLADPRPSISGPSRPKPRPLGSRSSRPSSARPTTLRRSLTSPITPTAEHSTLIALIQGVSARVDENAQRKTRYLNRRRASNVDDSTKAKNTLDGNTRRHSAGPSSNTRNAFVPVVSESGKDKLPVVSHRSLPDLNTLPAASSSADMDGDNTTMEVDDSMQMGMDTDSPSSSVTFDFSAHPVKLAPSSVSRTSVRPTVSSHSSMPPPPVPVPKHQPQKTKNFPHSSNSYTHSTPSSSSTILPAPRMHPLLLTPNPPPRSQPQPPPPQPRTHQTRHTPQPSSSRPPILGMRRPRPGTCSNSPFTPSQTLPDKQRGFKPPLAQPQPRSRRAESTSSCTPTSSAIQRPVETKNQRNQQLSVAAAAAATIATVTTNTNTPRAESPDPIPEPQRSSSPVADPDSSFGDMSLDMDALEETMRQYD